MLPHERLHLLHVNVEAPKPSSTALLVHEKVRPLGDCIAEDAQLGGRILTLRSVSALDHLNILHLVGLGELLALRG